MKIFALNLCLEFGLAGLAHSQESAPMSSEEWRKGWRSANRHTHNSYCVMIDRTVDWSLMLWELQAHGDWRQKAAVLQFVFADEQHRKECWEDFRTRFKEKIAAGGIVRNEQGEYLCIKSRGRWTFPKGHTESGESIEETALREVKEETGIDHLRIVHPLPPTLHTFKGKKKWKLKTTYWYLMQTTSLQQLIPQKEEGIEAAEWINGLRMNQISQEFYPQNRWLFQQLNPPHST